MAIYNKTILKNITSASILISALLYSGHASAQLNQQTIVADPGRIEKQLTDERLVPQISPKVSVKELKLQTAPEGAENIKFKFGGLQLEGASTYSEDDLFSIYKNMIGTEISLADLYEIANQMTLKYRNDGYILTQVVVPPQTIENGIAKLQIVEGFIDNVIIQGGDSATEHELKTIQDYASQISTGGALNIKDMERQLLLINDLPGLSARSIISPSKTTSGAADLLVIINERDPFEAQIGADNYGSRFLGPFQANGLVKYNSALGFNESITAQTVLAPDAGFELAFGSLTYEQPVGPWGTTLSVTGSITDTDPGYTLRQFDVKGISKSLSIQAKHPIIRSRDTNIFGRFLFDLRDVDSKNNVELTRKDRIRALRAGVRADFLDSLLGIAVNTIDLQVSQGIDVFGASNEGDANMTRTLGDPTFTKANLQIQRLQRVTNSVNVVLSGQAQLASNALLSSEEFGLGGINTVRGYDPSEVVGDDGIAGKIEVQWKTPVKQAQVFGFLDSGTVWDKDATANANRRNSLTSTGGGVRFTLPMNVAAELMVAQPIKRDIGTKGDRDPQYFFSVNKKF